MIKHYWHWTLLIIHQSIRLRPRRTCEQEHLSLSNAILHNSAARAKHARTHDGLLVVQWVVIGQYTMGQSIMDRSIADQLTLCRPIPTCNMKFFTQLVIEMEIE